MLCYIYLTIVSLLSIYHQGNSDIPLPVVLGTVFAIIVMAIVVTLLIFKYRENSQRLTEQSEVTKKKMHDLESQVARECKDGQYTFFFCSAVNFHKYKSRIVFV